MKHWTDWMALILILLLTTFVVSCSVALHKGYSLCNTSTPAQEKCL